MVQATSPKSTSSGFSKKQVAVLLVFTVFGTLSVKPDMASCLPDLHDTLNQDTLKLEEVQVGKVKNKAVDPARRTRALDPPAETDALPNQEVEVQEEKSVSDEDDEEIVEPERKETTVEQKEVVEEDRPTSDLLPTKYDIRTLPVDEVEPNLIIGGKSYSFDLLDETGQPKTFPDNPEVTQAAAELQALLPLPKPILVVNLPKAGTTSIHNFFRNSGSRTVHWVTEVGNKQTCADVQIKFECAFNRGRGKVTSRVGTCMNTAVAQGQPPLKSCGNYEVWAQMDTTNPGLKEGCYFPQIQFLQEIHQESPTATFILNRRNFTNWASSTHRWKDRKGQYMDQRLAGCKPFGPNSTSVEDLIRWHKQHIMRIRQFVFDHPTHALLEVEIQDDDAGPRMATAFGIAESYWGRSNHNKKNT